MIYNYPRPQEIYRDSIFLMEETVLSNKYTDYIIPYKIKDKIEYKKISHDFLLEAIGRGIITKLQKPGAFNNKPYYRIPLLIQLTLC